MRTHTTRHIVYCAIIAVIALAASSCARAPVRRPSRPVPPAVVTEPVRADTYHTAGPGETVWRLAKMYDVTPEEIMRANKLRQPQDLQMGQRLRIPLAAPLRPFIPLYPSTKWRYIIVHHSATDEGNALNFNSAHHQRGFDRGLGYHFVIDNGSCSKKDGQLEVAPRWLKQQDGAHCKASDMNTKAIGICLVGNFSQDRVSKEQMDSLVFLVNQLREYYNIPFSRIMGHSQVSGAATECPGTNFPWQAFRSRLTAR